MNFGQRPVTEWRALAGRWRQLAKGPLAQIGARYVQFIPLVMVLGLVASVLEGAGIGLLIPLVALLLTDSMSQGIPGPIRSIAQTTASLDAEARVLVLGAAVLGLIAFKAVVQAANGALIASIEGRIGRDLRNALSAKILSLDFTFFMRNESNRLAHIISTDGWFVMEAGRWMLSLIPAATGLAVFSVLLAWFDWRLFLIVLASAAAIQALLYMFEKRQRTLSDEVTASDLVMWNRMLGIVNSMRAIRVFGQQEREQERFAGTTERVRRAVYASQRLTAFVTPSIDLLVAALFVLILLTAYGMGIALPTITAFLVLLSRAQPHAYAISQARLGIASVQASIREVEWLLGQEVPPERYAGAVPPAAGQPVRFERVSYSYPDGTVALSDVTFALRPGIATALIGRSGAGKTTLVNLLCRLIEPSSGEIRIGERRLAEIDARAWRERVGIAGQDIDLVGGTVAQNIAYGRPGATMQEIEEAAAVAGASGFVEFLPNGYDTDVGHDGLKLSGGQRQRIGLARALLRRPDLLILDEATSAVDALSEREIIKLLAEHRHFRTALVISHRKSTLLACQEGIVLDHGRVLETGPLAGLAYFQAMAGDDD